MQTLKLCEHRSSMITDSQGRFFLSIWAEAQIGFLVVLHCWSASFASLSFFWEYSLLRVLLPFGKMSLTSVWGLTNWVCSRFHFPVGLLKPKWLRSPLFHFYTFTAVPLILQAHLPALFHFSYWLCFPWGHRYSSRIWLSFSYAKSRSDPLFWCIYTTYLCLGPTSSRMLIP